jgi:hypothetical protein
MQFDRLKMAREMVDGELFVLTITNPSPPAGIGKISSLVDFRTTPRAGMRFSFYRKSA